MGHCGAGQNAPLETLSGRSIALVGNPNAGKSVVFNALTGLRVDVSNYPGTTLDISRGPFGGDTLIDTPGVYGISSLNDEERVARDIILGADVAVNVVNAAMLERDLFLTQQVIDTGIPVLVVLNMLDEASHAGLTVDSQRLSELLGVPVVRTVAVDGRGMVDVRDAVSAASKGSRLGLVERLLQGMPSRAARDGESLLVLEGDPYVSQRSGLAPGVHQMDLYEARRARVDEVVAQVVVEAGEERGAHVWVSRAMIGSWSGPVLLALVLWAAYGFLGRFVAGTVVGVTEGVVMKGYYEPLMIRLVGGVVGGHSLLGRALVGDFGVLTMAVTYIVGLMAPLVGGFYLLLSVLEDSGYLPRIAALVDRAMGRLGLNGRAVIPLILGFGCVTMATVTTRLLGSQRERRIATMLLGLVIPCSAQLGIISGILANIGYSYFLLYLSVVVAVASLAGTTLNRVLPGKPTDLLIDLPRLRMPRLRNVLLKAGSRTGGFLVEAVPIFAAGALAITALSETGALAWVQEVMRPVTVGVLGLPKAASTVLVMGLVRRDFAAAGLASLGLTAAQSLVALITITLFVPCVATVLIMVKERGWVEATAVWLTTIVVAFIGGGVAHSLVPLIDGRGPLGVLEAVLLVFAPAAVLPWLFRRRGGEGLNQKGVPELE